MSTGLATLFRNVPMPLLRVDRAGAVLELNPAGQAALGWSLEELRSTPFQTRCDFPWADDFLAICARTTNPIPGRFSVRRGATSTSFRCEGFRLDPLDSEVTLAIRFWALNAQSEFVLLGQKLEELNDEVLRRKEVQHQLEQASRAKDQFLAMLGHELRNPLAPMVTALQLMTLRGGDWLLKERGILERQVAHLSRLIDDLLDVTRITQGKTQLKLEVLDLREVIAQAVEIAAPLLEERSHRFALEVPERELTVRGDGARLSQVFSNLLVNAAKYTEPEGAISLRASSSGSWVTVAITDNGIGIEPEMIPSVFEMFVQKGQGLDRPRGGLGLGLTIVRSIVQLHGGEVTAHSAGPGKGSEFVVRLPSALVDVPGFTPAQRSQPCATLPKGETSRSILVVDDNGDAADSLAELLESFGHRVQVANSGETGLALAKVQLPEIALLDIGLPVMNGYELAVELRKLSHASRLWIVAISGYAEQRDRAASSAAGFDAHLVKPVNLESLLAVIKPR